MVYLASPYSHENDDTQRTRYEQVMHAVYLLMRAGYAIISPIVHCRPLTLRFDLPHHAAFWREYNSKLIRCAEELWVLRLDGWKESVGVTWEIALAKELKKPITYVSYFAATSTADATLELELPLGG